MSTLIGGLCSVGIIDSAGVVALVWRRRLALSIGPNSVGST
jgi:hypothetical protein